MTNVTTGVFMPVNHSRRSGGLKGFQDRSLLPADLFIWLPKIMNVASMQIPCGDRIGVRARNLNHGGAAGMSPAPLECRGMRIPVDVEPDREVRLSPTGR